MLNVKALEKHIHGAMTAEKVPALAVAVVDRERTLYVKGFGTTAADSTGRAVTDQTLFRIASTTKPLTATLIMCLLQDGLIKLDDPVIAHIPELRLSSPGAAEQVTVRHLLSHRSGLPAGGEELGHHGPNALSDFVSRTVPGYGLVAPPGVLYSYSNPGYSLLGHVAERVTGQTFGSLMSARVFKPLGMHLTTFDPLVALTYPFALPHRLEANGTLQPLHATLDEPAAWPAGFAIANALELSYFAQLLLNEGCTATGTVLRPESVREMLSPQADMLSAAGDSYGLGLFLRSQRGVMLAEHGGSIPTYESVFQVAPEHGLALVILSNRPHTGGIALLPDCLWNELLDLTDGPEPANAQRTDDLQEGQVPTGTFIGNRRGLVRLGYDGAAPWMELNGWRLPLRPVRKDVYVGDFDGGSVSLGVLRSDDSAVRFVLLEGSVCERAVLEMTTPPDATTLEKLVGRYESFDVITVELADGTLTMKSQMHGERRMTCQGLGGLRFASDYGVLEFVQAETGTVDQLIVWDQFPLRRAAAYT